MTHRWHSPATARAEACAPRLHTRNAAQMATFLFLSTAGRLSQYYSVLSTTAAAAEVLA